MTGFMRICVENLLGAYLVQSKSRIIDNQYNLKKS